KPFNPLELTVRVKSLIRRAYYFSGANNEDKDVIKVGVVIIDKEKQMAGEPAKAVEDLVKQANSEGIQFLGSSAYRSYDTQLDT
ncbi:DNA-binding response regulator, partial [Clostridioides difficile]